MNTCKRIWFAVVAAVVGLPALATAASHPTVESVVGEISTVVEGWIPTILTALSSLIVAGIVITGLFIVVRVVLRGARAFVR